MAETMDSSPRWWWGRAGGGGIEGEGGRDGATGEDEGRTAH